MDPIARRLNLAVHLLRDTYSLAEQQGETVTMEALVTLGKDLSGFNELRNADPAKMKPEAPAPAPQAAAPATSTAEDVDEVLTPEVVPEGTPDPAPEDVPAPVV